jgi:LysM repeat protein
LSWLLLIGQALAEPAASGTTPSTVTAATHRVGRGDTLARLADRYGVAIDALRQWNELADDTVRIGDELLIGPPLGPIVRYVPRPGETLGCISRQHGLTEAEIVADNPSLSARGLRAGVPIALRARVVPETLGPSSAASAYVVLAGDSLSAVASRFGVPLSSLETANPDVDAARLLPGAILALPAGASVSIGDPTCGALRGGALLAPHPGFVVRNPARAYGTQATVRAIHAAFDALHAAHPGAPRARVHDLSLPAGGPIDDHRSHQSGRDADITYFRTSCGPDGCPLEPTTPDQLDARLTFTLLEHWLSRDLAEVIYVDYSLEEPLYREAERRGATAAELDAWFQYPRGPDAEAGVIRHFPNHLDHLHVRFRGPGPIKTP